MATIRQKTAMCAKIGMFMLEHGKVYTLLEYKRLGRVPFRVATIKNTFGHYNKMLVVMEQLQPELWKELTALNKPKMAPAKVKPSKVLDQDDPNYVVSDKEALETLNADKAKETK